MRNIKKKLPNIMTITRLVITPVIVILSFFNQKSLVIALCIIAAITDFLDGFFARKYDATTEFGKKLDAVTDKIFEIGMIFAILAHNHNVLVLCIMEIVLGLFNLYCYYKTKIVKSLFIGKVKTTSLFITLIIAFINVFFTNLTFFKIILNGFILMSLNLQILSIFAYLEFYLDNKNKAKLKDITNELKETNDDEPTLDIALEDLIAIEDNIIET